ILTVSVAISLAGYRSARAAKESIGNTSACLVAKITEIQGRQERIQGLVEEVNHEAKTRNELAIELAKIAELRAKNQELLLELHTGMQGIEECFLEKEVSPDIGKKAILEIGA